ncbi:MAG TPA: response regulator [Verrucomicrobiae bacterium]|nr:response regulator [Verrucomicrobiae bacterium]
MSAPLKTLIVEDSAIDAELLVIALRAAGFDPEWQRVETEAGVRAALQESFDLVFSDFSMPHLSAFRVLQLLRERALELPCIIVSGTIGEEQVVETLKSGAVDYVSKDRLDRLSLVVRRAVREARERAERRQAEQQVQIRTLALEAAANGILIADRGGQVLWANAAFNSCSGCTLEEALDQAASGPDAKGAAFFDYLRQSLLAGRVWQGGMTRRGPTGQLCYEEITITPVRATGEAITHFIAVRQDVTPHRNAEIALQSAQEMLKRVLAHSPAVIYSLRNVAGVLTPVWVSENVQQLFGYDADSASLLNWWGDHLHPEDRHMLTKEDPRFQSTGHCIHEYRLKHSDGTYRWVSDEKRIIRETAGQPFEVVGVWTDITDRKQLEAQLRQAQKLESIGQLAGGVAHDFNNILTVIQGHASLLLSNRSLGESTLESAQQISLASERAATLTRQLLTFSRKQVMQPRALDLNEVVSNVIKMLKRILREDVSLQVSYGNKLPLIHADAGMLEQVLMNLAVNARDAMPQGGELGIFTSHESVGPEYVQTCAEASTGEFVRLQVADSGSGIAPDVLPRIFEPFFTTKPVGQGTGLGLATVHGIVHQHRGWVEVSSEVGGGTTFRVYFPVLKVAERRPIDSAREQAVPGGKETILLVEDEDAVRALAKNVLERKGYTVIEASSAVEALKNWGTYGKVDLVLTDIVMPGGMTGLDLIKQLHAQFPALPAVFTSGYSVDIIGKELELRDGINFLQKPYGPRRLARTVRDALDQHRTAGTTAAKS